MCVHTCVHYNRCMPDVYGTVHMYTVQYNHAWMDLYSLASHAEVTRAGVHRVGRALALATAVRSLNVTAPSGEADDTRTARMSCTKQAASFHLTRGRRPLHSQGRRGGVPRERSMSKKNPHTPPRPEHYRLPCLVGTAPASLSHHIPAIIVVVIVPPPPIHPHIQLVPPPSQRLPPPPQPPPRRAQ